MAALADLTQVIGRCAESSEVLGFGCRTKCQRGRLHIADPGLPVRIGRPLTVVLTGTCLRNQRGSAGQADGVLIGEKPLIVARLFSTLDCPNAIGRNLYGSPHEIQNTDRHGEGRRSWFVRRLCGPSRRGQQCSKGKQREGGCASITAGGRHSVIHRKPPQLQRGRREAGVWRSKDADFT